VSIRRRQRTSWASESDVSPVAARGPPSAITTQLHRPPCDKLGADNPVSPAGTAPDAKMRRLTDIHLWRKSH
jgi:hypothetical protein